MHQTRMTSAARNVSRMKAPPHPFPELQGPFEESMLELERREDAEVPSDAASRRTILLDAPTYERVIAGRWKQRPGERYHPLWKIVAQLSFGIHLLADNLAKSEEEVMQILQGHIDEIDLFLERTTEDFALAQEDIQERMRCLQLPLQHPKVFDRMLEDRTFRISIVEGNEKIEHIVARTGCAMRDSLKDAQKGLDATHALQQYLASLEHSWGRRNSEHEAVFDAMLENVEGWRDAFIDLHTQGECLGQLLKQLTDVINQMQQRAGEVSRRLIRAQQPGHSPTSSRNITYISRQSTSTAGGTRSGTPDQRPKKALPGVPDRDSTRQSSSLGQRSETAQSNRSARSQRSSAVPRSTNSSRADTYASARESMRDSTQARLNTKSPRLVDIKRLSPLGQELASTVPKTSKDASRASGTVSHPVELPAELPRASLQAVSSSDVNRASAGLGITQEEVSIHLVSTTNDAVPVVLVDPSKLPLTPSSMNSNNEVTQTIIYELPSEPVPIQVVTVSEPPKTAADSSGGSPPSTPSWAKQTFDDTERKRIIMSKTAFRSHPPNAVLGSPPVIVTEKFGTHTMHARPNGSIASSIGAPGPEIVSSGSANSSPVKGSSLTLQQLRGGVSLAPTDGRKVYVAELEGTTPFVLKPVAYAAGPKRASQRTEPNSDDREAAELEAPLGISRVTRGRLIHPEVGALVSTSASAMVAAEDQPEHTTSRLESSSTTSTQASQEEHNALEHKMAAAIRKSFIATNVELPGGCIERPANNPVDDATKKAEDGPVRNSPNAVSNGVEDLIARLDELNSTSPNLSLKGEDILAVLPAKTYMATREQTSPATSRSRPELPGRNSSESTASGQSQWRAFFKGQLSPAEFNASTPHLPSKAGSTRKALLEFQKRAQETSPTLGWQWAPETPEVEMASKSIH